MPSPKVYRKTLPLPLDIDSGFIKRSATNQDQALGTSFEDLNGMSATFTLEEDAFVLILFQGLMEWEGNQTVLSVSSRIDVDGSNSNTVIASTNMDLVDAATSAAIKTRIDFSLRTLNMNNIQSLKEGTHTIKIQGSSTPANQGRFRQGEMDILIFERLKARRET